MIVDTHVPTVNQKVRGHFVSLDGGVKTTRICTIIPSVSITRFVSSRGFTAILRVTVRTVNLTVHETNPIEVLLGKIKHAIW